MPDKSHAATRRFAISVVQQLRAAGFQALWAGGCVRDQLMGHEPKDYDVATSAKPDEVRSVFGRRRTLAIGAAFGVITVLGPRDAEPVEVATFRQDAQYSDGRHPDGITFANAEQDAQRRDFTINGLFYDPVEDQVLDYVEGQRDIDRGLVRAIRDPLERISEDKLRMLRAVRFAATFGFDIDEATLAAVREQAHEIVIVSAERVAAEMRRMLIHPNRVLAVQLLEETGLLEVILPESLRITDPEENVPSETARRKWMQTLKVLGRLASAKFPLALAGLLIEMTASPDRGRQVDQICRRWRLSRLERETTARLLTTCPLVQRADQLPWPQLQPILVAEGVEDLLEFCETIHTVYEWNPQGIQHCRQKLRLPPDQLNPQPLLTGQDLIRAGIPRGPRYKELLTHIRDAQLDGTIGTKPAALELVQRLVSQ